MSAQRQHSRSLPRLLLGAVALVLGLCFAPGAHAQGGGMMNMDPQERATQRVTQLTEALKLTPQQVEQVKPIVLKQYTDSRALFQKAQGGGDMQSMRGEMQALREKADADLAKVLTAEQQAAYKKFTEEEAARRAARMGGQR